MLVTIQYILSFWCSVPWFIICVLHPVHHAIRALLNTHTSLSHSPTPLPSEALGLFLRVYSLSWFVPPSVYPPFFFPFVFYRSSYFLCSIHEKNHMIIVFVCLTYFTQHYLLQSRPCCCKCWVIVLSDGWVIFHCIYGPHLLNPVIHWRVSQLLSPFSYCGQFCYEHWGAYGPFLHYFCIFGINTQ